MFEIMPYEFLIYKPGMMAKGQQNEMVVRNDLTRFDKHLFQQHLTVCIGSSVKLALRLANVIQ